MKKVILILFIFSHVYADIGPYPTVYIFNLKDEIGPPTWREMQQAFREAKEAKADLILIHINTYGGMLIHADSMRTRILQSKIPVWVYIDNNAASAGALISIACDSIYMNKGASIGAASVVNQTGEVLPEKYQSYMRSMMRSTAEAKGRNAMIAQKMVDPTINVEGISDTGKVITFTSAEAMQHGFCEGIVESIEELLKKAGVQFYDTKEYKPTTLEKFIGFLVNPAVSGILIMIIIGGIYFELQTPGIGFPLAASVIAALLYFAPLYLDGMAENWEIFLFLAGLILIAVEFFVTPGFGMAGILGALCAVTGLAFSLVGNVGFDFTFVAGDKLTRAFLIVFISLFISVAISVWSGSKLLSSPVFSRMILSETQDNALGYTSVDTREHALVGKKGISVTMLRPSGKVEVEGTVYDATAEVGFIEKGVTVTVIRFETAQIVVQKA